MLYDSNEKNTITCQVQKKLRLKNYCCTLVGRDSAVGIATCYKVDGPGIEAQWGRDFPHLSRPALEPTQPLIQCIPGLSHW